MKFHLYANIASEMETGHPPQSDDICPAAMYQGMLLLHAIEMVVT